MPVLTSRRLFLIAVPTILVAGGAIAARQMFAVPSDLDLSLRKTSADGRYVVSIAPEVATVTVGPMHAWTVSIRTAKGKPVERASIAIDGGMPQHGHGLPTAPAVTKALGDGRFLVEGMRFNMSGWWVLNFAIDAPEGADTVTFNVVL